MNILAVIGPCIPGDTVMLPIVATSLSEAVPFSYETLTGFYYEPERIVLLGDYNEMAAGVDALPETARQMFRPHLLDTLDAIADHLVWEGNAFNLTGIFDECRRRAAEPGWSFNVLHLNRNHCLMGEAFQFLVDYNAQMLPYVSEVEKDQARAVVLTSLLCTEAHAHG